MAAQDHLEAREIHQALVVQRSPEGPNRRHHILGIRYKRFGGGDPYLPEARQALGLYLDGPPHGLPPLDGVVGGAARELFDGALAVGCQEGAQLADILL